jgi:hypothetical protein
VLGFILILPSDNIAILLSSYGKFNQRYYFYEADNSVVEDIILSRCHFVHFIDVFLFKLLQTSSKCRRILLEGDAIVCFSNTATCVVM